MMRAMAVRVVVIVVIALLLGAAVYLFVLRQPVEAPSAVLAGVTIECDPWSGVDVAGCGEWGDEILSAGPPSRTFNMSDLDRLRLRGSMLGLGDCQAAYYLGRNPNRAVWDEETACPGS
jgi:hypothetical protein